MRLLASLLVVSALALPACSVDAPGGPPADGTAGPRVEAPAPAAVKPSLDRTLVRSAIGCQLWAPGDPPKTVTCPEAPTDLAKGEIVTWEADGTCSRKGGDAARAGQVACPALATLQPAEPLPNTDAVPDRPTR